MRTTRRHGNFTAKLVLHNLAIYGEAENGVSGSRSFHLLALPTLGGGIVIIATLLAFPAVDFTEQIRVGSRNQDVFYAIIVSLVAPPS
ncbi:Uncharacterized protein TCM_020223 [Theobroma cacao]|uniref:Uncharacterized protein n=1 Tax=Theobroma cacao TaxID=3641 RepID=A0A061EJF5_THECC|nr:Uncharacterized protein TCM_020223 [Theobroma cacao]